MSGIHFVNKYKLHDTKARVIINDDYPLSNNICVMFEYNKISFFSFQRAASALLKVRVVAKRLNILQ